MILVKAKRDELLAPLAAVSGIIERAILLSNVLIEKAGDALSFSRHGHRDSIASRAS
jgi:hypothetical protein